MKIRYTRDNCTTGLFLVALGIALIVIGVMM